jgi:hypothetical protein
VLVELLASEGHIEPQAQTSSRSKWLEDRVARALGAPAIDVWADLPRYYQEALFKAAAQSERDEALRERLARFLHDRQRRSTVG